MPSQCIPSDQKKLNAALGHRMQKLREQARLSREQVARALTAAMGRNFTYRSIWMLENGRTQWPAVTLEKFEEVCGRGRAK